jgi:hypothetical protein
MYKHCFDVVVAKISWEKMKGPSICTFKMQQKKLMHNMQVT